jgi:hypothetical protein
MPRQSSRSLGCAAAARWQLPLPLRVSRCRRPLRSGRSSLHSRAGFIREAAVGRGRPECGFAEIKGAPSSPRSKERAEGWLFGRSGVIREIDAPSATPSLHRGVPFSGRKLPAPGPPPCGVPPKSAAPRATALRRVRSFLPPAPPVGVSPCGSCWMPLVDECSVPQAGLRSNAKWRRRTPTPNPGKARANRSTSFRQLSRPLLPPPDPEEVFGGPRGP